jgi:hypothetical protein
LNAYWERLHGLLAENRNRMSAEIETLLKDEIDKRRFPGFDADTYHAYYEAAVAFMEERIEAYNPVGLQYLFNPQHRREAAELEFGLDWFDAREEFRQIVASAARKAKPLSPLTRRHLLNKNCRITSSPRPLSG